jgi:hypothetical protein
VRGRESTPLIEERSTTMDDISVLGNPMAEEPEVKDTNAAADAKVVCPPAKGFVLDRLVSAAVSPSFVPPIIVAMAVAVLVLVAIMMSSQSHPNILTLMNVSCILMAVLSLSFVPPYFRRVTRRSGMLEKLGAGKAMISARAKLHLVWSARLLFFMFGALAIFCFMFMFAVIVWSSAGGRTMDWKGMALLLIGATLMATLLVACASWWHTLKIASALVHEAIHEVIDTIEKLHPLSKEWDEQVDAKAMLLATETLPQLSDGWGTALGIAASGCLLFGFGCVLNFLNIGSTENLVNAFFCVCFAFFLALDVAAASSECDKLMVALNNKRISDRSMEVHDKLQILEVTLSKLNRGQGLGFTVGGKVLDRTTLRMITAAIGAVVSTALPVAFALSTGVGEPPSFITQDVFQLPSGRFIAVNNIPRNWSASVEYCASRGMAIASMHSQADADSFEWLIKHATYLGAVHAADGWEWVDGSPWTDFTHKRTDFANVEEGQHLVTWPTMGWTSHRGR